MQRVTETNFNSIKVRLEQFLIWWGGHRKRNFNSIKVRLEPISQQINLRNCLFQFHKGTIRTLDQLYFELSENQFQFHKGTIRTL